MSGRDLPVYEPATTISDFETSEEDDAVPTTSRPDRFRGPTIRLRDLNLDLASLIFERSTQDCMDKFVDEEHAVYFHEELFMISEEERAWHGDRLLQRVEEYKRTGDIRVMETVFYDDDMEQAKKFLRERHIPPEKIFHDGITYESSGKDYEV